MSLTSTSSRLEEDRRAKEEWLRVQAEKHQQSIVNVRKPMSVSPSLYFGTRRTTYSDVISIVTTVVTPQEFSTKAARKARTKKAPLSVPVYASPLQTVADQDQDEYQRRNSALWDENKRFMEALRQERNQRKTLEHESALILQRTFRGYILRKNFDNLKVKLKMKKKIRSSMQKVTKGTAIILEEKERRQRHRQLERRACITIQNRYRQILSKRVVQKERKMCLDETQNLKAVIIQAMVKKAITQSHVHKLRLVTYLETCWDSSIVIQKTYRGYKQRCDLQSRIIQVEHQAVVMIQFQYKKYLARKVKRKESQMQSEFRVNRASIAIQRMYRGKLGRRRVRRMRAVEKEEVKEACTVSIQRVFRGHLARRMVRFEKARSREEKKLLASFQIQCVARGFIHRKRTKLFQEEVQANIYIQARLGKEDIVDDLFHGFGTDVKHSFADVDAKGNTILLISCRWGHKGLTRKCLRWGFEIDHENKAGDTSVSLAVKYGHTDVADYLISKKAKLTFFGRTTLHEASRNGMAPLIVPLLVRGIHVDEEDEDKKTALHESVHSRDAATLQELLNKNAKPNKQQKDGQTPLHLAAAYGDLRMIQLLLNFGADVSILDGKDRTSWRVALSHGHEKCAVELRNRWIEVTGQSVEAFEMGEDDKLSLINAISTGDVAYVESKLDQGLSIDYIDPATGNSLLMLAAMYGQKELVDFFLKRGCNLRVENYYGQTSLSVACAHPSIALALVEKKDGADILHKDCHERTPLHEAAKNGFTFHDFISSASQNVFLDGQDSNGWTALHEAAQLGNDVLCRQLMSFGASPNFRTDSGALPFHLSAKIPHGLPCIQLFVTAAGVGLVSEVDKEKRTAMHYAAKCANIQALEYLLKHKGSVNSHDENARTPCFDAVCGKSLPCLRLLVENGASLHKTDRDNVSLLHEAVRAQDDAIVAYLLSHKIDLDGEAKPLLNTPLHLAAQQGYLFGVRQLVEASKEPQSLCAKRNIDNEIPILGSIKYGHVEVFEYLKVHVDLKELDERSQKSFLHWASEAKVPRPALLTTLIESQGLSFTAYTKEGWQPLHLAAMASIENSLETIKCLINFGAPVNATARLSGMTPLHCAARAGNLEACRYLVEEGARKELTFPSGNDMLTAAQVALTQGFDAIAEFLSESE